MYCNVELCKELRLLPDMCIMFSCLYEVLITSTRRLRPIRSGHLGSNNLNMAQLAHTHCTSLFSFCFATVVAAHASPGVFLVYNTPSYFVLHYID